MVPSWFPLLYVDTTKEEQENLTVLTRTLSNYQLNEDEIKVLAKGLKFIPSPRNINTTDIKKFSRWMRLKEYVHDINKSTDSDASNTNEHDYEKREFRKPSAFTPKPNREPALDLYL